MHATTVKLNGELVKRLNSIKPQQTTLTGFVRDILAAAVRRQADQQAAEAYVKLLREDPDELYDIETWSTARLDRDPSVRKGK